MKNKKLVGLALIFAGCQIGGCAGQYTYGTTEAISRLYEGQAGNTEVAKATEGKNTDYFKMRKSKLLLESSADKIKALLERVKAAVNTEEVGS